MTQTTATQQVGEQTADKTSIRPFHFEASQADLTELLVDDLRAGFKSLRG